MADSTVLINGQSVTDGYNATASSTIDVELSDSSGSNVWTVTCIGSDEGHTTSQPTITLSQITKTGTIVLPSGSGTFIFRSKVNPGMETEHSSTFGVFVRTTNASLRKFAVGLGTEGSQSYGQIPLINALVDEVDTLAAGGGGGSYTAGDGLTLTGSDFDIDLTDTTKFTTTGAASRAVVTDVAGGITVGGFTQPSGSFNVDAGGEAINLTTTDNVSIGAGDGISIAATNAVTISGTSIALNSAALTVGAAIASPIVSQATKTSDAAPNDLTFKSQEPFATATGANRKPGNIILDLGTPTNSGTDYGKLSIKNGGSERLSVGYSSSETTINATNSVRQLTSSGNWIIDAQGAVYLNVNTVAKFQATSSTTTIANTSTVQLQSTGGAAHLISQSANTCSLNGGYTRARTAIDFAIENFNASFEYWKLVPASNLITQKWENTGYAARKEERYFYGTTTGTATSALSGTFTPSITNGIVRCESHVMWSTASGALGSGTRIVSTFRIAAGVLTKIGTDTETDSQEDTAHSAPYHDGTGSGGTVITMYVIPPSSAANRRWEAYTTVYYSASY